QPPRSFTEKDKGRALPFKGPRPAAQRSASLSPSKAAKQTLNDFKVQSRCFFRSHKGSCQARPNNPCQCPLSQHTPERIKKAAPFMEGHGPFKARGCRG